MYYSLAKISFGTAKNEPLKVWRWFNSFSHSPPNFYGGVEGRAVPAAPRVRDARRHLRRGPRRARARDDPDGHWGCISKIGKIISKYFAKNSNFWRARSRLYQNEFLQVNMRILHVNTGPRTSDRLFLECCSRSAETTYETSKRLRRWCDSYVTRIIPTHTTIFQVITHLQFKSRFSKAWHADSRL